MTCDNDKEYKLLINTLAKGEDIGEDGHAYIKKCEEEEKTSKPSKPFTDEEVQVANTSLPTETDSTKRRELQNISDLNNSWKAAHPDDKPYLFEPPPSSTEGFRGNWPALYEYVKNERLDDSEESAKKLNRFIQDFRSEYEKGGKHLRALAENMHLYDSSKATWPEFLQTPRYAAFKDFIQDILAAQQRDAVEKIFDDGTILNGLGKLFLPVSREYAKRNYNSIGSKSDDTEAPSRSDDGTISNVLNKLLMPVFREYAKRNYNSIGSKSDDTEAPSRSDTEAPSRSDTEAPSRSDTEAPSRSDDIASRWKDKLSRWKDILSSWKDMAKDMPFPLIADALSGVAMRGSGRFASKPIINGIINNAAAPVITEAGNVLLNDKEAIHAAIDAGIGGVSNKVVPDVLKGIGNKVKQLGRGGFTSGAMTEQARINEAANKAAGIEKRLRAGESYFDKAPISDIESIGLPDEVFEFYGTDHNPLLVLSEAARKKKGTIEKGAQKQGKIVQPDEFNKTRNAITPEDMKFYNENQQFIRSREPGLFDKLAKNVHKKDGPLAGIKVTIPKLDDAKNAHITSLEKYGDLRAVTPNQLAILGLASQETKANSIGRNIANIVSEFPQVANALKNVFIGKPEYGQQLLRGFITPALPILPDAWTPYTNYVSNRDKVEEAKKLSPLIQAILANKKQNPDE